MLEHIQIGILILSLQIVISGPEIFILPFLLGQNLTRNPRGEVSSVVLNLPRHTYCLVTAENEASEPRIIRLPLPMETKGK